MKKQTYIKEIQKIWQLRQSLNKNMSQFDDIKQIIDDVLSMLESGEVSVCKKYNNKWQVNEWIKQAILLNFYTSEMKLYNEGVMSWYDKIDPKFYQQNVTQLQNAQVRLVPGAFVRKGTYLGLNTVIMPSFINIGAHVGNRTLVDTWATVGSCAHIGDNCHISGGVGIGGVLEPLQAKPVIIEDNCFIGARSEIVEGVLVEEGSVIGMGVFLGQSTKIVERHSGKISYGIVPPYSVVVPGVLPAEKPNLPGLYCAVIIKQVDKKTREKTSINELLRNT